MTYECEAEEEDKSYFRSDLDFVLQNQNASQMQKDHEWLQTNRAKKQQSGKQKGLRKTLQASDWILNDFPMVDFAELIAPGAAWWRWG